MPGSMRGGIREVGWEVGGVAPDSARCVAISTDASLREMIAPGALAVVVPLVVGFISVDALGGLLAGALVTGFALAIFMANSGGAWDNAKKYIEAGAHGGKGGDPHKAAVVGDTVGDPFKDTSSVAMNPVIKFTTLFGLLAVELAVSVTYQQGSSTLTHILAAAFFAVSVFFVHRSFYGMRITKSA